MELLLENKSTINLAKNFIAYGRSKHIKTKFQYLNDQVSKGKIIMAYCNINDQVADFLTKLLKIEKFKEMKRVFNIVIVETSNKKKWLKCNSN